MFEKRKIIIFLFTIWLFSTLSVYAQKTSVTATIQPAEILIGEQAVITLDIKTPVGRKIITPEYNFADTLVTGIEVLSKLKPDTIIDNEVMTIKQSYIVTSFDSTLYNIPYMYVIDGADTIRSRNLGLKVSSIILPDSVMTYLDKIKSGETDSIDFVALGLHDIKDIRPMPSSILDTILAFISDHPYLFASVIVLFLLALIGSILAILYFRKRNKGYYFKPQVILPPHVVALQMLEQVKVKNLCQRGLEKQYYTELSDIVRTYIEKRYYIHAMEQTSDETISAVENFVEDEEVMLKLKELLKMSDLVKFAKYHPLQNENDLCLMGAYFFINKTKKEPEQTTSYEDVTDISSSINSEKDNQNTVNRQEVYDDKALDKQNGNGNRKEFPENKKSDSKTE